MPARSSKFSCYGPANKLVIIQYDLFNRIPKFLHIFQEVEEEELTADEVLQRLQVR